jgi:xylulokinase
MTLGIDLGTSAVKVAAVRADGTPAGEGAADFETYSTAPLEAEQSPDDWLCATSAAMRALAGEMNASDADWARHVGAIGLTGQLPTLVVLGRDGPIARAITWKDGRADAWAAERIARADHYARTGMPIDGRYLAPMWQFHLARRAAEVRRILSAKDYLLYALTGLELTEPSTAAGYGVFDLATGAFAEDLCRFWGLPASLLPGVRPSSSLAGPLSARGVELLGLPASIPVSTGAADSACAAYAMAGLDERCVSVSFGSSAVIFGASSARRLDSNARYLLTPHVEAGWYGREMDLLASGTGYRWLSELFSWQEGEIDRSAARAPLGAHGLVFAPYLGGGEQGALWNPRLRGAIWGLDLTHSRADIARAYLEGVFYEVRRCIEVLAESAAVESVWVGGRVVNEPSSVQMLSDVLGRPVGCARDRSPAAVGAAILARRLLRGAPQPHRQDAVELTSPDVGAARRYDALYQHYLRRAAACE